MNIDTTETETQDTLGNEASGSQTVDQHTTVDTETTDQTEEDQKYQPFSTGKEKFKVDGREYEWDFQTAQKWAQLGYAGRRAMQEKAELTKKHQDFYNQLTRAAETDIDGLYEVLTGRKRNAAGTQTSLSTSKQLDDPNAAAADPRLTEIQQAMKAQAEELKELREDRESRLVEQEAKAIEQEFADVEKKFPAIAGNKYLKHYIKAQYAAELRNGNHLATIEDVAFFVTQEMEEQTRAQQVKTKQVIAEKKAKSSLPSQKPGGEGSKAPEFKDFNDVRKLAGLL